MELSNRFLRHKTSTGRTLVQLTSGPGFCYPLYYFIPSITRDQRYMVYHQAVGGEVQLYRLDLQTGQSVRLTSSSATNAHWYPWCTDPGRGVLDHRSSLDVEGNRVIYFHDREARAVHLDTLEDELLFSLPPGREAIGQNCVMPDGEWFIYIHADRAMYESIFEGLPKQFPGMRWRSRGTALAAYHLKTGEHRILVYINSPIHHVIPYGNEHVLFCHPAAENGMLLTDLNGGWYTHMRTQDETGGTVCHFLSTSKGIAYEVQKGSGLRAGLYHPFHHFRYEWPLPTQFVYAHTGYDPEARLWFFENKSPEHHDLWFLERHDPVNGDAWIRLLDDWDNYGTGQKAHFHPRLTPDRRWIILTLGDANSQSNHIYLLGVSDLEDTQGIPAPIHRTIHRPVT